MFQFDENKKGQRIGEGHFAKGKGGIFTYDEVKAKSKQVIGDQKQYPQLNQEEEKEEQLSVINKQDSRQKKSKYAVKILHAQDNQKLRQYMEEFTIGFNNKHPFVLNYLGFDFHEIPSQDVNNVQNQDTSKIVDKGEEAKIINSLGDINKTTIAGSKEVTIAQIKQTNKVFTKAIKAMNDRKAKRDKREYMVYMLMKRMKNTLKDEIKLRKGTQSANHKTKFDLKEVITIFYSVASALAYLEEKGIVHKHVVPEAVHFDDDGNVKLGGFSLSKFKPWKNLEHRPYFGYKPPENFPKDKNKQNENKEEKKEEIEETEEERKQKRRQVFKSDVWCLGRLVIDICRLEPQVRKYIKYEEVEKKIVESLGEIEKDYGAILTSILGELLKNKPEDRLSFQQICERLKKDYPDFELFALEKKQEQSDRDFLFGIGQYFDDEEEEEECEVALSQIQANQEEPRIEHSRISAIEQTQSYIGLFQQQLNDVYQSFNSFQTSLREMSHVLSETYQVIPVNTSEVNVVNHLAQVQRSIESFMRMNNMNQSGTVLLANPLDDLDNLSSDQSTQNSTSNPFQSLMLSIADFSRFLSDTSKNSNSTLPENSSELSTSASKNEKISTSSVNGEASNMILKDLNIQEPEIDVGRKDSTDKSEI